MDRYEMHGRKIGDVAPPKVASDQITRETLRKFCELGPGPVVGPRMADEPRVSQPPALEVVHQRIIGLTDMAYVLAERGAAMRTRALGPFPPDKEAVADGPAANVPASAVVALHAALDRLARQLRLADAHLTALQALV